MSPHSQCRDNYLYNYIGTIAPFIGHTQFTACAVHTQPGLWCLHEPHQIAEMTGPGQLDSHITDMPCFIVTSPTPRVAGGGALPPACQPPPVCFGRELRLRQMQMHAATRQRSRICETLVIELFRS